MTLSRRMPLRAFVVLSVVLAMLAPSVPSAPGAGHESSFALDLSSPAGAVASVARGALHAATASGRAVGHVWKALTAPREAAATDDASIAGSVFNDADGDGVPDAGESALSGVHVTLSGAGADATLGTGDDVVFTPVVSASDGSYAFSGLAAGSFRVDVTSADVPSGLVFTGTSRPLDVVLAASQHRTGIDWAFGPYRFTGGRDVAIAPGLVSTLAGSGTAATTAGTGSAADLNRPNGVVVIGDVAYVGTKEAIQRVALDTGVVTTLAGGAYSGSCTDSTTASSVRFAYVKDLATDGTYLYSAGCNKLRKTSIATGATSTYEDFNYEIESVTLGPDGYLYAAGGGSIHRFDRATGARTVPYSPSTWSSLGSNLSARAVTSDGAALYVLAVSTDGSVRKLVRVALATGAATLVLDDATLGVRNIESAGAYLYAATGMSAILRVTKATGVTAPVAGTLSDGWADGAGPEAWFSTVGDVAADRDRLVVADLFNHRVRKVVATTAPATGQPASAAQAKAIAPGLVSTLAGSGTAATVSGTGTAASFYNLYALAATGGAVYVATHEAIQRVDAATAQVTTLAGGTYTGSCTESATAGAVRIANPDDMATDGRFLYVSSCFALYKTSITTGAMSLLVPQLNVPIVGVTVGPDGYVYYVTNGALTRVDPVTGASTSVYSSWTSFGNAMRPMGLTSDETFVYATLFNGGSSHKIVKWSFATGAATEVAADPTGLWLHGDAVTSAGDWLYVAGPETSASALYRVRKSDGTREIVAGSDVDGYADGIGTTARFGIPITDIASDGTRLYVADYGNKRLRLVTETPFLPSGYEYLGYDPFAGWSADVNLALRNYVRSDTDATVATYGPTLAVTRTYNSTDPRDGAFGTGWSSDYEMTWETDTRGNVAVLWPDGRRELHTLSGGVFAPPAGYHSSLVTNGSGGYVLTGKDGTVYQLSSAHRLTSVTDVAGHAMTLTYDGSGHLATVQAANGRTLTFTWSGSHVDSVSTGSVAAHGGPLTWRYYYTGALLTRACDPRDNSSTGTCVVYQYTLGRLTQVLRPKGITEATIGYTADGLVEWREDGLGNFTRFASPAPRTVVATDPRLNTRTQVYDTDYRLVSETDAYAHATTYTYDSSGNRTGATNRNGDTTSSTFDARGNAVSMTDGEGHTAYATYDSSDNLLASRDPRSSGSTDNTYRTTYTYDAARHKLSETGPATAEFPSGTTKSWTWTTGTETAIGGGTMPAGLMRTESDHRANVTTRSYDSSGNLREILSPLGAVTQYAYDELGRRTSQTEVSDTFPSGVTTTWTYDVLGEVLVETDPSVTNPVTSVAHRRRATTTYDLNENPVTKTEADIAGSDPTRVTTIAYDSLDRPVQVTDAEGGVLSRTFDAAGNVATSTDRNGRVTRYAYDARNLQTTATLDGYRGPLPTSAARDLVLLQAQYDAEGRKVSVTDELGRVVVTAYDHADRVLSVTLDDFAPRTGGTRDVLLEAHTYDAAGNVTSDRTGSTGHGQRYVTYSVDAAGRRTTETLDPSGLNRVTTHAHDADGRDLSVTLTDGTRTEQTRKVYDAAGNVTSTTVENGTADLVTTGTYDNRGLLVSSVEPRGNDSGATASAFRTDFVNDALGRRVSATLPAVLVEPGDGTSSTARPATATGYDTFGDATHTVDARGAVTSVTFDRLGRATVRHLPSYTRPDAVTLTPTETVVYDANGNVVQRTDRRGMVTDLTYDLRDHLVRQQDPLLTGASGRGERTWEHDDRGNVTAETDQRGARVEHTYDMLDRVRTTTAVVRVTGQPSDRLTTTYDYDDLGKVVYTQNPADPATTATYSTAGERLTEVDGLGKTTTFTYDVSGRTTSRVDPLGNETDWVFDNAGRQTAVQRRNPGGLLAQTTAAFDSAGFQTSATDARGFTTTSTYDAAGRLTARTQPVSATHSIQTTFGYDAAGNATRLTDGNAHVTLTTYTPWQQAASAVEPSTTAYPNAADRTWTTLYDAGGLPAETRAPGGVTTTRTFDQLGRMTAESATGGGAASASRAFGYDLAGLRTSASHPTGTIGFTYDDRGLMTATSGPAGTASYAYDAAGRLTQRTDAAGTATFGYTDRGELASATDGVARRVYSWDDAGRRSNVSYRTPAAPTVETAHTAVTFDDLDRLTGTTLVNGASTTTAAYAYQYDADGNLTQQSATLASGTRTDTFTYDRASRLASWTAGAATTSYTWDDAGNRTQAGAASYVYDARNRLTSGPAGSYAYTARGTLTSITNLPTGATAYVFDALDRMTGAVVTGLLGATISSTVFTYDALDRVATRGAASFTYEGANPDPVGDGTTTYSRSPSGGLLSVSAASGSALVGLNRHGDVAYEFGVTGTVAASRAYDPFGVRVATAGTHTGAAGYQGDWTDPATSLVGAGARWLDPGTGTFASRDSISAGVGDPAGVNRFAYGNANPLRFSDPTGHMAQNVDSDRAGFKSYQYDQWEKSANSVRDSMNRADAACDIHCRMWIGARVGRRYGFGGRQWQRWWRWNADFTRGVEAANRYASDVHDAVMARERRYASLDYRLYLNDRRFVGTGPTSFWQDMGQGLLGVRDAAVDMAKTVLNPLATAKAMVDGYHQGGFLTALNQLNPAYHLMNSISAYRQAVADGDFRAIGRSATGMVVSAASLVAVAVGIAGALPVTAEGGGLASRLRSTNWGDDTGAVTFPGKRLRPNPAAEGAHSTFRVESSGSVTHYATWEPQSNPFDPAPWTMTKRVDVIGDPHFSKVLGEYVDTPHVQGPGIPGGVRPAEPWELPS